MDERPPQTDPREQDATRGAPPPRPVPMAAIAGAVILVGLVAFALYRRGLTAPQGTQDPSAASEPATAAAPGAPSQTAPAPAGDAPAGTTIAAPVPTRLSPEASVLAERYRCVCGCNLTLSVCTCRNDKGSEDMKKALNSLV